MIDGVTETVQDQNVEVQDNSVNMEQFNLLQEQLKLERGKTSSLDSKVAELMQLTKDKEKAIEDIKTSKMSESEKLSMELEKMKLDFQTERQSRTRADNKSKALELMQERGIDKRYLDFIPLDNADDMAAKLESLSILATETMKQGAQNVVNQLGGNVPTGGQQPVGGNVTYDQYKTMSVTEQNKVLSENRLRK